MLIPLNQNPDFEYQGQSSYVPDGVVQVSSHDPSSSPSCNLNLKLQNVGGNVAPCLVLRVPPKQIGYLALMNVRESISSRAAFKYTINSMRYLYVSTSGLVTCL